MYILGTLFRADLILMKRWFAAGIYSRLFVASLFFLLFGGIAYALYGISNIFFNNLAAFDRYGQMTAAYIIHAAIAVVLWLSLTSSVAAASGTVLTSSPSLTYLLTLPVPRVWITTWTYLKTISANLTVMLFVFVPVTLSYAGAFDMLSLGFLLRTVLVLSCLVIVSGSVGMLVALALVGWLRGHEYHFSVIGFGLFFGGMVWILKLVFPPALSRIYDATSEQFAVLFAGLPLNNPVLPTFWLAQTVTSGISGGTLIAVLLTAAVLLISLGVQIRRFVPVILAEHSRPYLKNLPEYWKNRLSHFRYPLLIKDWLSLVRLPSETGYGLFLISIAAFFFLSLSYGTKNISHPGNWQVQLIVFSFSWLMFFTIALLLRFIFPLVSREGRSAWYLFSLPKPRTEILLSKVLLAVLSDIPLFLLALIVWRVLPFAAGYRQIMFGASIMIIFFLSLFQTFLGAIAPNFSLGHDPEKVSTSGMGILTLGLSVAVTAEACMLVSMMITGRISQFLMTGVLFAVGIFLTVLLWLTAGKAMQRYEW